MPKYRAWYIPQVPMKAFEFDTENLLEAKVVLDAIERFSLFEYANNVKPYYCDASGIAEWDEENQDWYDVEEEWDE